MALLSRVKPKPKPKTDAEPGPVEPDLSIGDLSKRHRRFKQDAAAVLHEYADQAGWCTDYDAYVRGYGLPGRSGKGFPQDVPGESTVDAFETWRRETGRKLAHQARRRSLPNYGETLRRAGFPVVRRREVVIRGTFELRYTDEYLDDDPIQVEAAQIREKLYGNFRTAAEWTVAEAEAE